MVQKARPCPAASEWRIRRGCRCRAGPIAIGSSIQTGSQYVTLDKSMKCFILAVCFGNPSNKTVMGIPDMRGLLIANHLHQSLWSTNKKYWAAIKSNILHSFLEMHHCVAPFTSHAKVHLHIWCRKTILLSQTGTFSLFHNILCCLDSDTEHRWRCS